MGVFFCYGVLICPFQIVSPTSVARWGKRPTAAGGGCREGGLAQRSKKSRTSAKAPEDFFGYRKRGDVWTVTELKIKRDFSLKNTLVQIAPKQPKKNSHTNWCGSFLLLWGFNLSLSDCESDERSSMGKAPDRRRGRMQGGRFGAAVEKIKDECESTRRFFRVPQEGRHLNSYRVKDKEWFSLKNTLVQIAPKQPNQKPLLIQKCQ